MFSFRITTPTFRRLPAAALLLTLGACTREAVEPQRTLPEATQSGLNTAGARIDGQLWLPATVMFAGAATKAVYQRVNGQPELRIHLSRVVDGGKADPLQKTNIILSLPGISAPGTVPLDRYAQPNMAGQPAFATLTYSLDLDRPERTFITGSNAHGLVTINRLDTVAHVVAGTFTFQAKERGGTATTSVTEGRFDLRY